ncbi:MAG: DUF6265 family protein [Phycisphaerales bacterium]|nr:DUF6265 family protein [Phycisphaerales bacterium]
MPRCRTLIIALTLIALALVSAGRSIEQDEPPLSFLAGHWRSDHGSVMEEFWFPPEHGSTSGVLRWLTEEGAPRMHELLAITPRDDGTLEYRMRHFDREMMPWASEHEGPLVGVVEQQTASGFVIRCAERSGALETITYLAPDTDTLRVSLAFSAESGRDPIEINLTRVR